MKSRIFIDCDTDGAPMIRIEYNHSGDDGDVRDKLVGRFLFDVMYGEPKNGKRPSVDVQLVHGHEHVEGTVAFIRFKPKELSSQDNKSE